MSRIVRVCPHCGIVFTAIVALECTRCGGRTEPKDTRTWGPKDPRVILKVAK